MRGRKVPIERLKQNEYEEYKLGCNTTKFVFIGREIDTKHLRNYSLYPENYGRILDPESRGEKWSEEKNMAFMLGAIEAKTPFLIVSPLNEIIDRANLGITNPIYGRGKLGYAVAEMLWLKDNGYIFMPYLNNSRLTWAFPPYNYYPQIVNYYGHANDIDAKEQIVCLEEIADDLNRVRNKFLFLNYQQTGFTLFVTPPEKVLCVEKKKPDYGLS